MPLTKDEILARRSSLPTEEVDIPEWGGSVRIRLLTLREVEDIMRIFRSDAGGIRAYYPVVEKSCVNEDGTQMFVGEDVKLIPTLPWGAVERIVKASMKLSKMLPEESANGAPKD